MKLSSLSALLASLLTVGALVGAPPPAPANPLDGKVFLSVEKLTGGERPGGGVNKIHWKITFKGKEFTWLHTDVVSSGTYEYDAKTGDITLKGPRVKASYDAKTGVLTWGGRKYKAATGAK